VILKPVQDHYRIELLGQDHDREGFSCGIEPLDIYIRQQAGQDSKRNLAAIFIMTADSKLIAGYYTLSAHSLNVNDLPLDLRKKLPRIPIPVTLLGRMAISTSLQRQGLGAHMLADALERTWRGSRQIVSWAMVVDAKDGARDFYLTHGFLALPDAPNRLFLAMKTIGELFRKSI
jgi:predicted GNAT family N-acyltransferase